MPKQSLIKKLLERRIPQILGSYLVAGTSLILFIEYLVGKYHVPSHYPTLSLFALSGILPSVVILAYFHGAPGKDEWTKVERIGIPINVLFIAGILFFGDSMDIWKLEPIIENTSSNVEKQIQEKMDSYYIKFTSNQKYIDDIYKKYNDFDLYINRNDYSIYSIEDSLLEIIKKQCFNTLNVKFQNKGIDIYSNFNPSHINTMDSLEYPYSYKRKGAGYPVNELSRLLNVEKSKVPKVFIDILIYNRKHLHSDEEKLFYARFSRIRTEGNISQQTPQYFENNKNGHNKLIENLKKHLVYNIDQMSFSKNPFHKWIGEVKEVLPNDMLNVKLYSPNSIKSNLELKAQKRIRYTKQSIREHIIDIQLGIDFIEQNKEIVPDSIYQNIFELEQDLDKYENLLDSLINNNIHKTGINWNHSLGYKLEVISVMDTIAVCKLLEKEKPWVTVRVGHKLIISE